MKTMRLYALLILLAVGLAFSAGTLSLSIRNAPKGTQGSASEIGQIKTRFIREHRPEAEIVLSSLFPSSERSELLDPSFALPQNRRYSFQTLSHLYRYAQTCSGPVDHQRNDPVLTKSWQWLQFKCGARRDLPADFFESPPFTFALGGSFAFLGVQSTDRLPIGREWVQNHIRYFHISELPRIDQFKVDLEVSRKVLASMSPDALRAIAEGDDLVLGEHFVLRWRKKFSVQAPAS